MVSGGGDDDDDEDEDDDEDDESSDDEPVLTFITAKKRQQIIKETTQNVPKAMTLEDQLATVNAVSSATINQAIQDAKDEAEAARNLPSDGLPDDTDHLEDTQIDVMMWREREAKRVIQEVQELMKHMDFR